MHEYLKFPSFKKKLYSDHNLNKQYERIDGLPLDNSRQFSLSTKDVDSYFQRYTDPTVYKLDRVIQRHNGDIYLKATTFAKQTPYWYIQLADDAQFPSSRIGIYKLDGLCETIHTIPVSDVAKKYVVHTIDDVTVGYPLIL